MKKIAWSAYTGNKEISGGVNLLVAINSLGYEAYAVGGFVRDLLMGLDPHDFDIATNMPIDKIKSIFKTYEYGNGLAHGTIIVKFNDYTYELTQFRTESTYTDSRRPDNVEFVSSFEEDIKRRDFTINAMAIDKDGNIIGNEDGIKDLDAETIRAVGDPNERFKEDALRILRAIRFAVKFKFNIDTATSHAIVNNKHNISNLSTERIMDELAKIASSGARAFAVALKLMREYGFLENILPGVVFSDVTVNALKRYNGTDMVTIFAIATAFDTIDLRVLKCSKQFTKDVNYVKDKLLLYSELGSYPKMSAYEVVSNHNFNRLRDAYVALNERVDIPDADTVIADIRRYKAVADLRSTIHTAMNKMAVKKSVYKKISGEIQEWLADEFKLGTVIDEFGIEAHIIANYLDHTNLV